MSLQSLFAPKSIALIGASTTVGSVGNDIARNLVQSSYSGQVFFVNPKAETLYDRPCYASIKDIGEPIDLAVIVVPAKIVPTVLRETGEKEVRAAVIISSGFKETGGDGARLEEEVKALASEYQITLLGPNCLGFIAPNISLNASFASALPRGGSIAFFSQSGALMSALLDQAKERLGFSIFASLGNKTFLDETALMKSIGEDDRTHVVGFYTEGLHNADAFIATGRSLLQGKNKKPVIILKSGQTEAGAGASNSHTGAVAGGSEAYAALFRQARMIQARSFSELLDLLDIVSKNPFPKGKRLAIVTNAGGLGVLATDAAVESGLQLAKLADETKNQLRSILPQAASVANPIDVLGDAQQDRYQETLSIIAQDPGVDMLLVILTPQTMTKPKETAEALVKLRENRPDLPLVAVFAGHDLVAPGVQVLLEAGIPAINFPEAAAQGLGWLGTVAAWSEETITPPLPRFSNCDRDQAGALLARARQENRLQLNEHESASLLSTYGFPFAQSTIVTSEEEAVSVARQIGKPIALKIVSPDIIHKSDAGGVRLQVNPEDAGQAFCDLITTVKEKVPEAKIDGVLMTEMAPTDGLELLLGLKQEPGLGTLIVLGLGGIYVEVLHDIAMRFVPLTNNDVDEMIHELKSYPLLAGTRGQKAIDFEKLKEGIGRLNQLALDFPEIIALDINPLLAFPEGERFRVLDARITLAE